MGEKMSVRKLTYHVIGKHSVFLPISYRSAWVTDAGNDEIRSPIVVPAEWANVFSRNSNPFTEQLSILIGPKGVGKSTLLHLKRAIVEGWVSGFAAPSNVVCLPAQDDMLSFKSTRGQSIRIRAGTPEWKLFAEQDSWIALWRLLLATLVLQADFERRAKTSATFKLGEGQLAYRSPDQKEEAAGRPQLPQKVLELFDKVDQRIEPQDIVRCINSAVGKKGLSESTMSALYEIEVLPLLRKHIGTTRYCLFVDAIDEHLRSDEGMLIEIIQHGWMQTSRDESKNLQRGEGEEDSDTSTDSSADLERSYNIWANAQAGLVLAAMDLFEDSGKKVRVYAPIRSEAYHVAAERVAEAQLGTCARVVYGRDRLETIVRLNMAIDLELNSKERYFPDDGQSISEAVLAEVERAYFNNREEYLAYGTSRRRWVSEIVRFSMERPRELMVIGKAISRSERPDLGTMTANEILLALHRALPKVLEPFLQFIVGRQVADHMRQTVFPFIRANVLNYQELQQIQAETQLAQSLLDHPMCKLYSLGLIGDVMSVPGSDDKIQRFSFSSAGRFNEPTLHLPSDSELFVVHPVLASALTTVNLRPDGELAPPYRRNEMCPIGDELPWSKAPSVRQIKLTLNVFPTPATVEIDGKLVAGLPQQRGKKATDNAPKDRRGRRVATANSRPYIVLVAWLYTVARLDTEAAELERITESVKMLARDRRIKPRLSINRRDESVASEKGRGKVKRVKALANGGEAHGRSMPVADAVNSLVEGLGDSHDIVVDIRRFLNHHLGVSDAVRVVDVSDGVTVFASAVVTKDNVTLDVIDRPPGQRAGAVAADGA